MARTYEKISNGMWKVSIVEEFEQKKLDEAYINLFNTIQSKKNELTGTELYIKNIKENLEKLNQDIAELKPHVSKKTIKDVGNAEKKIEEAKLKDKRKGGH